MPINTLTCPSCGARTNYTVELDENNEQSVTCIRCGESFNVDYNDLPERLQETITELAESNSKFAEEMNAYSSALDGIDTVEETIQQVSKAFDEAKQKMKAFDSKLKINTDIESIAEQYIPSDDADNSKVQSKGIKKRAKQAAADKARKYARAKIADKFGATEEELDDIFSIAGVIQSRAKHNNMNVAAFIKSNPGEVTQLIAENTFTEELAPQLIQMMGSGSFTTLMDMATALDK